MGASVASLGVRRRPQHPGSAAPAAPLEGAGLAVALAPARVCGVVCEVASSSGAAVSSPNAPGAASRTFRDDFTKVLSMIPPSLDDRTAFGSAASSPSPQRSVVTSQQVPTMRSSAARTTLTAAAARVLERDEVRRPPILAERGVGFAVGLRASSRTAAPSAGRRDAHRCDDAGRGRQYDVSGQIAERLVQLSTFTDRSAARWTTAAVSAT
jgi:hypothetical protein